MLNRRATLLLALLILLVAFGYGLVQLFNLRFAHGDVYPPYSSLRADPLGSRVYYESLEQLGGAGVRRFIQPVGKLPHGREATLFIFGLAWDEMSASPNEFKAIDNFVREGGRLGVRRQGRQKAPGHRRRAACAQGHPEAVPVARPPSRDGRAR